MAKRVAVIILNWNGEKFVTGVFTFGREEHEY